MSDNDFNNDFEDDENFNNKTPKKEPSNKNKTSIDIDKINEIIGTLSPDQYSAATYTKSNALLIAPAGTGKTRTMTSRYLYLASQNIPLNRIVMCTFTNAAANELINRVKEAVNEDFENLWIGTTHSIGLKIIRHNSKLLGFSNVDTILDREQQEEIIKNMMKNHNHPANETPNEINSIIRILKFIENSKENLKSPEAAISDYNENNLNWGVVSAYEDLIIYKAYEDFKKSYDMLDYNDMLYIPTKLIESNENVKSEWRNMFDHIMVDEYQDLSKTQIRLLKNIIKPGSTIFYAAADDDQSIYSWRGSDIKATIDFKKYWNNAEIILLRDNYRTPRSIYSHASKLIINNSERHDKDVRTRSDPKAMIRVFPKDSKTEEKEAIVENIKKAVKTFEIEYSNVAILCRSNKECQEFATYLSSKDIPINLHESLKLSAAPIRSLITWMQLSTKADNPLMYNRMGTYPIAYLSESAFFDHEMRLNKERSKNNNKIGPVQFLLSMHQKGKTISNTKEFAEKIIEVKEFIKNNQISPFAKLCSFLNIDKIAAESNNPDDHQITAFLKLADDMVEEIGLNKTLSSLTQLDLNAGKEGVNIATMHGAKGLEFEVVALPGWEEGQFPNNMKKSKENISEERRLAYVAITRAKKMLIITWSGNNGSSKKPSKFIVESGFLDT